MSRPEIQTHSSRIRAAHRYEVVEVISRSKVAGVRFHFVGAGGIGMSGLAQFLLEKHAVVTGSDQSASATTARLGRMGAQIHIGHDDHNVDRQTEVVILSAAVKDDNPELRRAREQGCKIYKYAQFLGEMMNHFEGIAIAGTHGKSTTSGWLAYCLRQAGVDTNFVVGAEIPQLGVSAGTGNSEFLVAEACEYDRSFLNLRPRLACLLNIERDHLDCYPNEDAIVDAFYQFALGSKPGGLVVANGRDPNVARVLERLGSERAVVTFGLEEDCTFHARNVQVVDGLHRFDAYWDGQLLGPASISLPGQHNVLNALAVIAVAVSIGVDPDVILGVLDRFTGMDRRLMLKGQFGGVTVLDDYAHHPTEIKASLSAIRQRYAPQRLWCVFQAHQYSRTRFFLEEFAGAFSEADTVLVPEIYFVRDSETSRSEVNAAILAQRIQSQGTDAIHLDTFETVCDHLEENSGPGDLVVTMGAGDVWKVADEYIQRLGKHR